ncbi:mechanosensitive ion channel family protein [Solimonas flava]|uniref:mechanosensitive ion channel family protein n=1 Tax=Solimonas flava TaxID=415849 RepID=UPI00040813E8|nr:mechanosensitive ion channel domain-containing protein [Solimonas flava]
MSLSADLAAWNPGGQALAQLARHPLGSTFAVLAAALTLVVVLHALARTLDSGRYAWQRRMRAWLGIAEGRRILELRWLLVIFHFFLWQFVAYLMLHIWGLRDEAEGLLRALFSSGIKLGGVRVVFGKLLAGTLLFIVLFTFTRWLKRKLEDDWLVRAGVEPSTRDAAATLFGYVTFIVTALIGLSYAGLDLSNLAIVAGALSVGIGFGLQNIVSNFVSGLILLFERPVRTGDYISVGGCEGVVRRMRIRATELETGDRETVIVPNSNLLSNPVMNRNLRTRAGRVVLPVGVAYGSKPEQVRELLLRVAAASPQALAEPAPLVLFTNFGASSLDFELTVWIGDADAKGRIASDLRFAIVAAFAEAGIEMPFPQQDVHIRSLPPQQAGAPQAGVDSR